MRMHGPRVTCDVKIILTEMRAVMVARESASITSLLPFVLKEWATNTVNIFQRWIPSKAAGQLCSTNPVYDHSLVEHGLTDWLID